MVVAEPTSFDVGVHPAIAARNPQLRQRMALELADLDGIISVLHSAPDALQVHAPDWHADQLQRWLTAWMEAHAPFIH
ncbi:hypothetical protein QYM41_09800 [Kocuria sp. CPCC 205268]|uniref:hypothetical protein n=1 Tax=Kocuria oxytropis TaxID=3058913 RepID=UPI0034D6CD73